MDDGGGGGGGDNEDGVGVGDFVMVMMGFIRRRFSRILCPSRSLHHVYSTRMYVFCFW